MQLQSQARVEVESMAAVDVAADAEESERVAALQRHHERGAGRGLSDARQWAGGQEQDGDGITQNAGKCA